MSKALKMSAILTLILFIIGCATPVPVGSVYTGVKLPIIATANGGQATKIGTARCTSILMWFAWGDASIDAAMKNGGITKVHHVDWDAFNILGIIGKYKTTVYGE